MGRRRRRLARGGGPAVARRRGRGLPHEPERTIYNNTLLERDLGPVERLDALDLMEAAYASAGIDRFAASVHESDQAMRYELQARRYTLDTATRARGMALSDIRVPRPDIALAPAEWSDYVRHLQADPQRPARPSERRRPRRLPPPARAPGERDRRCRPRVRLRRRLRHLQHHRRDARRRGLGTAVTARLAYDAAERGCCTASLQSTEMAVRVYVAVVPDDLVGEAIKRFRYRILPASS